MLHRNLCSVPLIGAAGGHTQSDAMSAPRVQTPTRSRRIALGTVACMAQRWLYVTCKRRNNCKTHHQGAVYRERYGYRKPAGTLLLSSATESVTLTGDYGCAGVCWAAFVPTDAAEAFRSAPRVLTCWPQAMGLPGVFVSASGPFLSLTHAFGRSSFFLSLPPAPLAHNRKVAVSDARFGWATQPLPAATYTLQRRWQRFPLWGCVGT